MATLQLPVISTITILIVASNFQPIWTQNSNVQPPQSGNDADGDSGGSPILAQQESAIVTEPISQAVEQNKSAYFRCEVHILDNDLETYVVSWIIDGEPFSYDGQIDDGVLNDVLGQGQAERYKIVLGKTDVIKVDLNITSAQGVDNGREFSCAICSRVSVGRTCHRIQQGLQSETATLSVTYRPDITKYPSCRSMLPDYIDTPDNENQTTVVLGQSVVLNCTTELANPPVTLKWFKNNDLLQGEPDEFGGFTHLEYSFPAALADNKTVFKCGLRSDYFNLDAECELPPVKVVSYPTVTLQSPGALPAGKNHQFICTAKSNTSDSKRFEYLWTHDKTFSKPVINSTAFGSVFSIEALSGDHGDTVRCFVTDTDGMTTTASAVIKIESELSVGAIAGIASAVVLCVGLLLLAIFLLVVGKKTKKNKKPEESPQPSAVPMLPSSIKPEKLNDEQYV